MTNQVILVTGANNGIGLYLTESLLQYGNKVAEFDLQVDHLSEPSDRYPDQLQCIFCDVSDKDQVRSQVNEIVKLWGKINVLVNNACLAIFSPFEEKGIDDAREEFEVHYFGYLHMISAVLPHMKVRGRGVIHNISSGVGFTGFPGIYGYASTKAAIESMNRTLSMELKPYGIHVNLLHPPLTDTRSISPLGIPQEMMADPSDIGKKMDKRIGSTKANITPDFKTTLGLFLCRHFPDVIGRFLTLMTQSMKVKREDQPTETNTGRRLKAKKWYFTDLPRPNRHTNSEIPRRVIC
jgi:NAD(P)-dependent dehydrogenase (short-subunit alcohol dehydrogenase family)